MPKTYTALTHIPLLADNCIANPPSLKNKVAHIDDPAVQVMTDFNQVAAMTVLPQTPIAEAMNDMKAYGVHALLVVDNEGRLQGLINTEDILSEATTKLIHDRRIARAEVTVEMVMIPKESVLTLDEHSVTIAKVGHIVATLQEHKQHYALVVRHDPESEKQCIYGLFSASEINRQLGDQK